MCTKSSAWPGSGADPPFPTSQKPNFPTSTPAHAASTQPHQYVTPSTPQTGSVRKHLAGHEDGVVEAHNPWRPSPSPSPAAICDGSLRTDEEEEEDPSCSAVTAGRMMQRAMTAARKRWTENLAMMDWWSERRTTKARQAELENPIGESFVIWKENVVVIGRLGNEIGIGLNPNWRIWGFFFGVSERQREKRARTKMVLFYFWIYSYVVWVGLTPN